MKFVFWVFLACFCACSMNAQKLSKKDSLRNYIRSLEEDTLKALEYIDLGNMMEEQDSMRYYYDVALDLSRKSDYSKGISRSLSSIANWIIRNENLEAAMEARKAAIKELEERKYFPGLANHNIRLGYMFTQKEEFDSVYHYIQKGVDHAEMAGDKSSMALGNLAIANTYYFQNEFEEALQRYFNVISISSTYELGKTSLVRATAYEYSGIIFENQENPVKASEYYKKASDIYKIKSYPWGIHSINVRQGGILVSEGKYDEAIPKLTEAIDYFINMTGDDGMLAQAYEKRGESYYLQGNMQLAEQDFRSYSNRVRDVDNPYYERRGYYMLGRANVLAGNLREALSNFDQAIEMTSGVEENEFILRILEQKLPILKQYGNTQQVAETYDRLIAIRDSLDKVTIRTNLEELEANYQNELQQKEIELLASENEQANIQKANQRRMFLIIAALLLIIVVALFVLYRNKNKVNQQLQQVNELRTNLYTDIAHEIRTPLTLIKGPVEKQLNNGELPEAGRRDLELIRHNTNRMLSMLDQMMDLSKVQSQTFNKEVVKGNLALLVDELISMFRFKASERSIELHHSISGVEIVKFSRESFEKIISNLLENAVKYSPEGGKVIINSETVDSDFRFSIRNSVSNTSDGLRLEKIFDRHARFDTSASGMGIGLSLVHELVKSLDGQISVSLDNNDEITFDLQLPIVSLEQSLFGSSEAVPDESPAENDKPLILIVEDNSEIRNFTAGIFNSSYEVIQAVDGSDGIRMATEKVPDIIVSDVMMPDTDGVTLCKTVKGSSVTSHIPIILLTAKVSEENELEGLQVGADSYVRKPFNPEILKQQVVNLLDSRDKLRDKYSRTLYLEPVDTLVESSEAIFIGQLTEVLKAHLSDPEFNAASFAGKLSMSRMQLHRKLKALFGLSTTAFLRSERVKASIQHLESNELTISEIAYSVGFNTPSYYIKCFKEIHGVTPQEYSNSKA